MRFVLKCLDDVSLGTSGNQDSNVRRQLPERVADSLQQLFAISVVFAFVQSVNDYENTPNNAIIQQREGLGEESELKALIYPLVQVTLGAIKLVLLSSLVRRLLTYSSQG